MIYIFAGDNKLVEPGPLSEGFARYDASEMEHYVFEFLLNYVRRVKSDTSVNQINDLFEINLGCELLTVSKSKLIVSNLLRYI